MTPTEHHTCHTCNTPVLPMTYRGTTYRHTAVHQYREYIFCSTECITQWEGVPYELFIK